jgi:putative CocE/NonD family hydrolase
VRLFVLGENRWHDLPAWLPSQRAEEHVLHLGSKGKANSRHGNGTLSPEPPMTAEPRDVLVCDPDTPVPAPGAGGASGPFCQDRIEAGNNVLVYTSSVLEKPLRVAGRPRVSLHVSSSTEECDVVAKLVRVDKKGRAWNITLGAARAKRLFGPGVHRADEVSLWEFDLDTTACTFEAGERIRLEVANSAFPQLDRSSNRTDVPACEAGPGRWKRVTHQLVHEAGRPSRLLLPLLPTH